MATAGKSLSTIGSKLNEVETIMSTGKDVDEVSVYQLLESVTEVTTEYKNLRKDLKEVQKLQKEMTATLIFQRQSMMQTFRILKQRIKLAELAEEADEKI